MALYSCIMFESMGVVNLAIPKERWQKSLSLTPSDNA